MAFCSGQVFRSASAINNLNSPTIAFSSGDPAGIGPEAVLKSLNDPEVQNLAR